MTYVDSLFGLQGSAAAVIGGGGVLAGCMAEGLARAGANVAVLDLIPEAAEQRAKKISSFGVKSLAIKIDASSKDDLEVAAEQIVHTFGRIDVLVNAAGINSSTPIFEITEKEWHKILDVNLKSMFLACQIFGKIMILILYFLKAQENSFPQRMEKFTLYRMSCRSGS